MDRKRDQCPVSKSSISLQVYNVYLYEIKKSFIV